LFNDKLATGCNVTGAILSCHVELSKKQHKKSSNKHKEEA